VVLALVLTFVFSEVGFVWFIGEYWWWLLLVSCCYFLYCRSIGEEEKKYRYLRQGLLYGNFYVVAHVFFRPLLNIEPALFLLLGMLILGMFVVQHMEMKVKKPFYRV